MPHGELKPANLVLGELPGGRLFVWVLDWGLSAYRAEAPPDALPWMAPERLAGGELTAAADIFSLGACLCWLLTGQTPVAGQSREELAAAWLQFPTDALRQVRPDLPPKFTRWVASLMEVNPKDRPTAAQARGTLAALQPPAPPVLPEIFRPRPKSHHSTIAPPAAAPVRRPVYTPPRPAPPRPRAVLVVDEKSNWPWIWTVTFLVLAALVVALPFLRRRLAPEPYEPAPAATSAGGAERGASRPPPGR